MDENTLEEEKRARGFVCINGSDTWLPKRLYESRIKAAELAPQIHVGPIKKWGTRAGK